VHADPRRWNLRIAADLYVAAFLTPKTGGVPANRNTVTIPTTTHVFDALAGRTLYGPLVGRAQDVAGTARAFHWPLEFPDIIASGGFDVVLGNPPWDVAQLNEEEYFAQSFPEIAQLVGAARKRAIRALRDNNPTAFAAYLADKRRFEAGNEFARASEQFEFTARGKINCYALFAELFDRLLSRRGRAGLVVPTGIVSDATTADFFAHLVSKNHLAQLIDFENRAAIFSTVHRSFKFSLLTMGRNEKLAIFAFYLTDIAQLNNPERIFTLTVDDIARVNPNTNTAPLFRTRTDADLTAAVHSRIPVFIRDDSPLDSNDWQVTVATRIWNMTEDAGWFRTAEQLRNMGSRRDGADWIASSENSEHERYVPLYEAKMFHQFDHRWATHQELESRDCTTIEKSDPNFEPTVRYWVPEGEVANRLTATGWKKDWLVAWRNIARATDERTTILAALPRVAVGNSASLMFVSDSPAKSAGILANFNAITLDYIARNKVGGTNLRFGYLKQFPLLRPSYYTPEMQKIVVPRVLELTYTSHSMAPFARDLGYDGRPFKWDEDRRAQVRAELDALYARAYGLSRDELRYILDPADVKGADYPSETFRVLKTNEIRRFGEYRTARLVLEAWDRLERGELAA
jgi:hypothetical protein